MVNFLAISYLAMQLFLYVNLTF